MGDLDCELSSTPTYFADEEVSNMDSNMGQKRARFQGQSNDGCRRLICFVAALRMKYVCT